MASTRRFPQADLGVQVARAIELHVRDATAILLALSGGRDSVVLLDVLRPLCNARGIALSAAHVHHGLSPHAEEWASFCAALCTRHCVPLHLLRVDVGRGASTSIEAAARDARYRALAGLASTLGVQAVLLAQHADDQAETVLLQLARGAGPRGISAMPAARRAADGVAWLRPLLDVPRAAIDAHAAANALEYVDDDSNTSARFRRNALRQMVVPALRAIAPGYPHTLVRAAALAAEASLLADELAALDARDAFDGQSLARAPLAELAPHRARNLLRWYLRANGCRAPSAARLAQMLAQLAHASPDAQVELLHDGTVIGVYAGRVRVHAPPPPAFDCVWHGEPALVLAHGTLDFLAQRGAGLRAGMVGDARWSVRARSGGERLTLDRARPRRMLKALLQEAGLPAWERDVLPLLFCGDALAAVPGIGVDVAFRAEACGILVSWRAHPQNRATKTR